MARHQEIRTELQALYAKSAAARNERIIREIEHQIDLLEGEAAAITTSEKEG